MGRPRSPLLSHERIVTTALEVIDADGLDATSLERLADELGVKAPSLYHHFHDKAEILAAVARAVLVETPLRPRRDDQPWIEWFVEVSCAVRRVILRHRHAAPLLGQFLARDLLVGPYEEASAFLERSGVPIAHHVLVLESLETLTLGTAIREAERAAADDAGPRWEVDATAHPTLARALAANPWSAEDRLAHTVRRFLSGVAAETADATVRPPARPDRRPARREAGGHG